MNKGQLEMLHKNQPAVLVVEMDPGTRFVASPKTSHGLARKWVKELSPGSAKASPSRDPYFFAIQGAGQSSESGLVV